MTRRQILFWIGQQRAPAVPLYNMALAVRIGGPVDEARFAAAFADLVRASDAFRSVFQADAQGRPRCEILPSTPGRQAEGFTLVDLSDQDDPQAALDTRLPAQGGQLFDLGQRCWSSTLYKLSEAEWVWFLCQHHLIGDGASVALAYRFLEERYRKGDGDEGGTAVPKAIHSCLEAERQEQAYLASARAVADQSFWASRGQAPIDPQVFQASEPEAGERLTERLEVELAADESEQLRARAAELGMAALPALGHGSLLTTALVAFAARVTGRNEVVVGIPLRGRYSPAARKAIGCFIEVAPLTVTVPVTADAGAGMELDPIGEAGPPPLTFRQLFGQVSDQTRLVLAHGQHCLGNPVQRPLYDLSFNLHTHCFARFAGHPVKVDFTTGPHWTAASALASGAPTPGEALALHAHDYQQRGRLTLCFDFASAHFDARQRQRAVDQCLRLLRALLADPDQAVAEVDLLEPGERLELLGGGTVPGTQTQAPGHRQMPAPPAPSAIQQIQAQIAARPGAIALRAGNVELSYRALGDRVRRMAAALVSLGVGTNVLVAIVMDRSLDMVSALLATLAAGGAYLPLDRWQPMERNALVLEDARPRVIVSDRPLPPALQVAGAAVVSPGDLMTGDEPLAATGSGSRAGGVGGPQDLAYVMFTSGSTGRPKGVAVNQAPLTNFLAAMQAHLAMAPGDSLLATTTICFDISILEIFLPLCQGATVDLADSETGRDPRLLAQAISERRPRFFQATPATFQMLLEAGWPGDPQLKVLCGGEAMSPQLATRLSARVGRLWNVYGPTETTVWCSIDAVDPQAPLPVTIGRPLANVSLHVLGPGLTLLPVGVVGEIHVGGAAVSAGYLGRPDLTAQRFLPDPFSEKPGARLYRTGDLGRRRSDGRIDCLGRVDSQVKIRGFRVELPEIEAVLARAPGVALAAAVCQSSEPQGSPTLVAYVAPSSDAELAVPALRDFLRQRLPSYMVPSHIVVLPSLPLTAGGKVDRKALPPPGRHDSDVASNPPKGDLEGHLAALFQRLLGQPGRGPDAVGRDQSFFDLGGHSLLAVQLLAEVNRLAAQPLSLGALFQHPTVAELAAAIERGAGPDRPLIIPLSASAQAARAVPLFLLSGIQLYRPLANALGGGQPVFGIYLPEEERAVAGHAQGQPILLDRLADGYLEQIRKHQPQGPYCLGGVSFGGLVAYLVAQRLERQGQEVALLTMFDTTLPRALRRRPATWALAHLKALRREGPAYVTLRVQRRAQRLLHRVRQRVLGPGADLPLQQRMHAYLAATSAEQQHLHPYRGPVRLFRASERDDFIGFAVDPGLGWSDLVADLRVEEVKGSHLGILEAPAVQAVARTLRHDLAELVPPLRREVNC